MKSESDRIMEAASELGIDPVIFGAVVYLHMLSTGVTFDSVLDEVKARCAHNIAIDRCDEGHWCKYCEIAAGKGGQGE